MSGNLLLDTNAAIGLLNRDPSLTAVLRDSSGIYLPASAVGELFYGAFKSGRVPANLVKIQAFLSMNVVLVVDVGTSREYGQLRSELRQAGRPIPENDIWIAACARQHELTLVTRDGHFQNIAALVTVSW